MARELNTEEYEDIRSFSKISGKHRRLTTAEEKLLVRLSKSTNYIVSEKAKEKLIKHNLRLILKQLNPYIARGVEIADLVQEGCIGFLRGVEKYDPDREPPIKLSTYVTWWIKQKMGRGIEKTSKVVKIPANRLKDINTLNKYYKNFTESQGRPPNSRELSQIMMKSEDKKFTLEYVEALGRVINPHVSLNSTSGEDDNLSMLDYLTDEKLLPEDKAEFTHDKQLLLGLLDSLSKEDRDFIKLKYGFIDGKDKTERQLSALLKIPVKEIKSRELQILSFLKNQSSIDQVNAEILCSLQLTSITSIVDTFPTLKRITGLSTTETLNMLNNLPATIVKSIPQHLALEYKADLNLIGAKVLLTSQDPS